MKLGELFEYGVAINFFGNYRSEMKSLDNFVTEFSRGLLNLRSLLIGGSLTAGLTVFTNAIMGFGKQLEGYFAQIKASVGTQEKTLSILDYASKKAAETPFSLGEVVGAVGRMTTFGFAKDRATMDKVFNAVGDLAGNRGFDFTHAMDMVAKAGFGNWDSLKDMTGLNKVTMRTTLHDSQQWARATNEQKAAMDKYLKTVETGTAGTQDYRMAVVELVGFLNKGGMEERLKTVGGVLTNLGDIYERFMTSFVGFSQVEGSFFNTIRKTFDNIYSSFNKASGAYDQFASESEKNMTVLDRIQRLGTNLGKVFSEVWRWIGGGLESASNSLIGYLMNLDRFMNDFPNKVAPLILFLYLIKLQIEDFFSGFVSGFKFVWSIFWTISKLILGALSSIVGFITGTGIGSVKSLGAALGGLLAVVLGFKMVSMLVAPFMMLVNVINMLRTAWTAWGAAALMNPMTWIILGVVALIAAIVALIYYWDEVVAWVTKFWNAFIEKYPIVGQIFEFIKDALVFVWDTVKAYVMWVFNIWKTVVMAIWNGLQYVWNQIKAGWNVVKELGTALIDFLMSPIDFVVKKAMDFWDTLKGIWDWIAGNDGAELDANMNVGYNQNPMEPIGQSVMQPLSYQPANYGALYQQQQGGGNTTNNYDAENKYDLNGANFNFNIQKGAQFGPEEFKRALQDDLNRKGKQ